MFLATPKVLLPPTVGVKEFWGGGTNSRLKGNGGVRERQVLACMLLFYRKIKKLSL